MRGLNTDQNVVIALFLNNMFLNCTLQDFSYLSKHFCPRILESVSDGHISKKIQFKPSNDVFFITSTQFFTDCGTKHQKIMKNDSL